MLGTDALAVELDPDLAGAHANLGYARLRLGDGRSAETAFRRALELEPAQPLALRQLAMLEQRSR